MERQQNHVAKWRWELYWIFRGEFEEVINKSDVQYNTKEAAKAEAIFECGKMADVPDCCGPTMYRVIREWVWDYFECVFIWFIYLLILLFFLFVLWLVVLIIYEHNLME